MWVIGDVHGCIFTLEKLVNKLPKNSKLIFVGDLVDRGNFAKEVIEFVIQNNYKCIFGNHEYLMFNYARDTVIRDKQSMWSLDKAYGGDKTVKSYQNHNDTLLKHIKFIETLPKYLEIDNYFITHGFGLPFYRRKDKFGGNLMDLYTNRLEDISLDWETEWQNYKVINIFGHTPYTDVLFGNNYIGIDTGASFGNRLSAINLITKEVISQNTIEKDIKDKYDI